MPKDQTTASDPTYLLEEGMVINDKWEVLNFIAKGGKGEVYLARQLNLDRQVALKIMSQDFIKSLEGDEEEFTSETQRFRREVQVMARMQHPNVLQVYDFDQLEINGMEMDYIVMEYVPGPTLRQEMPEEGYGFDEKKVKAWIKKYFFPILAGMKAVHDKGVVHRDMKPENVLVGDGPPRIMDFGIAGGHHFENVTQTHHMIGTITYMPEEQFMDLALTDARVDVYALGKMLYEVVEGKLKKGKDKPFNSVALNSPSNTFFKTLDRIIQQATSKGRNMRTPSVKAMYDSLKELVEDSEELTGAMERRRFRYWKYLFSGSLAVLVVLFGGLFLHHNFTDTMTPNDGKRMQNQSKTANPSPNFSKALEFKFKDPRPTSPPAMDSFNDLPDTLLASDNMTMVLLKGAQVSVPFDDPISGGKKQIKKQLPVKTLYMDKTKITNHLYAQFLNAVEGIEVENKSVSLNGQLLLLLGEVREGYEPVLFEDGEFRVKPDAAANPVVRVTPAGAMAYAQFYGKSLPLMKQWWLAVQAGQNQADAHTTTSSASRSQMGGQSGWSGHGMMNNLSSGMEPSNNSRSFDIKAVTQTTINTAGIQGLEQNVNEWAMNISPDGTPEFHIHGGVGELNHRASYLERQPWEAFARVGFRTVLELKGDQ